MERFLIELESSAIDIESSLVNWRTFLLIEFMSILRSINHGPQVVQRWTNWATPAAADAQWKFRRDELPKHYEV